MTVMYDVYDQDGDFIASFVDDADAAYDFAQQHEQVPNTWEVRKHERG
jgi:hypothetical protein